MNSSICCFKAEMTTTSYNITVSGVPLAAANSTSVYDGIRCVSRQKASFLLFCAFPAFSILINVIVLIAVLRRARKLVRQSHVYAHVSSTLIANVLFSVLGLLQLLSLYFHFGGLPNDPDPGRRGLVQEGSSRLWAFLKSFLCGMFVIMCGNIGLLIDCIRHSTCSTLRSAAGCRSHSDQTSRWKKKILTRRQRSYVTISVLWIVPIIYVAIPLVGWSCRDVCLCLSQCFPPDHHYLPFHHKCSRAFPPMANSWLAVVVISWASCLIAIIFFLRRSLRQVSKMWVQCNALSSVRRKSLQNDLESSQRRSEKKWSMTPIKENESGLQVSDDLGKDDVFGSEHNCDEKGKEGEIQLSDKGNCVDGQQFLKSADEKNDDSDRSRDSGVVTDRQYFCVGSCGSVSRNQRTSETSTSSLAKLKGSAPHRRMMEHLRSTRSSSFSLRYVIWLTITFGLCTAPAMMILTVDMLYKDLVLNMVALNMCLLFPFVYCYICPFILVKCLPGVKTSLSALILSVYSTTD